MSLVYLNFKIFLKSLNQLQKINLKNIDHIISIILLIIIILYSFLFLSIFLEIPKELPALFTSKMFKEIFAIILIFFSYLVFISKKIEKNYFIKFLNFSFLLSIFLFDLTLVDVFFIQSKKLKYGLSQWGMPLIHLSFFQDYLATKLQHAFIFFILFSFYIYNYITEKNSFIKNLLIAHAIFLIFLINSKLFYAIFFIYIFQVIIFNLNKENIKKIFQTLILLIIILVSFHYIVNENKNFKESNYKFSILNNIKLKFYYELKFLKLISDNELNKNPIIQFLEENINNNVFNTEKKSTDHNKEEYLFFYNSAKEREIIGNFCSLNKGLIFNKNKKIDLKQFLLNLKKNNSSLLTEYLNNYERIDINFNCESSLKNMLFYIGNFAYVLLFIFIISYLFSSWYYRNYFLFFNFVPLLLLFSYHHVFFNSAVVLLMYGSNHYSNKNNTNALN
jgi:hypothetical protein